MEAALRRNNLAKSVPNYLKMPKYFFSWQFWLPSGNYGRWSKRIRLKKVKTKQNFESDKQWIKFDFFDYFYIEDNLDVSFVGCLCRKQNKFQNQTIFYQIKIRRMEYEISRYQVFYQTSNVKANRIIYTYVQSPKY